MRDRGMKPRMKFTIGCEPPKILGRFENKDTLAILGQIGGADYSVVSSTNDNGVVASQALNPMDLFALDSRTLVTVYNEGFRAYTHLIRKQRYFRAVGARDFRAGRSQK